MTAVLAVQVPGLYAADTSVPLIRDRSPAIVSVRCTGDIHSSGKRPAGPGGLADLLLTTGKARTVRYARTGGGVIIDPKGIIVTNDHIVRDAGEVFVTFFNGKQVPVELVYALPDVDIAILCVKPPFPLSYIPLANSDKVPVGAKVYAIGHSMTHDKTIFRGKISGIAIAPVSGNFRRTFLTAVFGRHLFSGDSGSPLLDKKGYLVGLISAGRRDGDKATLAVASNLIRDAYRNILPY